uniref:Uncharacterized protein n=1 Tax=Arion vulgaris TaxID=1028688 RepID=A0A0B7A515_9EUPU
MLKWLWLAVEEKVHCVEHFWDLSVTILSVMQPVQWLFAKDHRKANNVGLVIFLAFITAPYTI